MPTRPSHEREDSLRNKERIDRVVDQVYRKYGSDLSAFFRDVKQKLEMERSTEASDRTESEKRK